MNKDQNQKQNNVNDNELTLEQALLKINELESEVQNLALTIDTVEDEKAQIQNSLKKAIADYMNLEKSVDGRLEIRAMHLKKDLAKGIIEVMDDLKYAKDAQANANLSEEAKKWAEGLLQSADKLAKALETLGVKRLELNPGDQFDSSLQEAVAVVPGEKDGTIHEVVQTGFVLGDIVVRPARVVVVKNN